MKSTILKKLRKLPKTQPTRTLFVLPDGVRVGNTDRDNEKNGHNELSRELGLTLKDIMQAGVVRYVPSIGIEAMSITEQQAQIVADDWIDKELSVDVTDSERNVLRSKLFQNPTADAIRHFVRKGRYEHRMDQDMSKIHRLEIYKVNTLRQQARFLHHMDADAKTTSDWREALRLSAEEAEQLKLVLTARGWKVDILKTKRRIDA